MATAGASRGMELLLATAARERLCAPARRRHGLGVCSGAASWSARRPIRCAPRRPARPRRLDAGRCTSSRGARQSGADRRLASYRRLCRGGARHKTLLLCKPRLRASAPLCFAKQPTRARDSDAQQVFASHGVLIEPIESSFSDAHGRPRSPPDEFLFPPECGVSPRGGAAVRAGDAAADSGGTRGARAEARARLRRLRLVSLLLLTLGDPSPLSLFRCRARPHRTHAGVDPPASVRPWHKRCAFCFCRGSPPLSPKKA